MLDIAADARTAVPDPVENTSHDAVLVDVLAPVLVECLVGEVAYAYSEATGNPSNEQRRRGDHE